MSRTLIAVLAAACLCTAGLGRAEDKKTEPPAAAAPGAPDTKAGGCMPDGGCCGSAACKSAMAADAQKGAAATGGGCSCGKNRAAAPDAGSSR